MTPAKDAERHIKKIYADGLKVTTSSDLDERVLNNVMETLDELEKKEPAVIEPSIWRLIMRSRATKLVTAALIIVAAFICFNPYGNLPDGTSVVYGKVIEHIRSAETVSCTVTIEQEGQEPQTMYCWTQEPNHERIETPDGKVVIVDTYQGRSIALDAAEKKAYVMTTAVTPKQTVSFYDEIKKQLLENFPDGSEENIGESQINGQKVVGFRLKRDDCEITVWAGVANSKPVMIELVGVFRSEQFENQKGQVATGTIADIVLGEELDQSLFSLVVPEGYVVVETPGSPIEPQEEIMQGLSVRIMVKLARACWKYSTEHNGMWPENLRQAIEYDLEDESFRNLTDPESDLGCVYIRPSKPAKPMHVLLYQAYDVWPEDGIIVSFVDTHTQIIRDEAKFTEHLAITLGQ